MAGWTDQQEVMMTKRWGTAVVAAMVATVFMVPAAEAKAPWVKKAQDAGHKDLVKNCASCHEKALPKKDDFKVNALGAWLMDQKKAKKAAEVDMAWLKDYKPAK
jgi:hypothetical protein